MQLNVVTIVEDVGDELAGGAGLMVGSALK